MCVELPLSPLGPRNLNSSLDTERRHNDPLVHEKLRYLVSQYATGNPAKDGLAVVGLGLASDEGGQVTEIAGAGRVDQVCDLVRLACY